MGEFLKEIRLQSGLSLAKTAEKLSAYGGPGCRSTLHRIENGSCALTSKAQWAYVKVFKLKTKQRLELQRLAGEFHNG